MDFFVVWDFFGSCFVVVWLSLNVNVGLNVVGCFFELYYEEEEFDDEFEIVLFDEQIDCGCLVIIVCCSGEIIVVWENVMRVFGGKLFVKI